MWFIRSFQNFFNEVQGRVNVCESALIPNQSKDTISFRYFFRWRIWQGKRVKRRICWNRNVGSTQGVYYFTQLDQSLLPTASSVVINRQKAIQPRRFLEMVRRVVWIEDMCIKNCVCASIYFWSKVICLKRWRECLGSTGILDNQCWWNYHVVSLTFYRSTSMTKPYLTVTIYTIYRNRPRLPVSKLNKGTIRCEIDYLNSHYLVNRTKFFPITCNTSLYNHSIYCWLFGWHSVFHWWNTERIVSLNAPRPTVKTMTCAQLQRYSLMFCRYRRKNSYARMVRRNSTLRV